MFNKTENHTHHTLDGNAMAKVESMMTERAVAAAKQAIASDRPSPGPDAAAGYNMSVTGAENCIRKLDTKPYEAPRLEPYHYEVKHTMKVFKLTEKEAERSVRKDLLQNAIWTVTDPATRTLAQALLALI